MSYFHEGGLSFFCLQMSYNKPGYLEALIERNQKLKFYKKSSNAAKTILFPNATMGSDRIYSLDVPDIL